jgi:hypothetical protein
MGVLSLQHEAVVRQQRKYFLPVLLSVLMQQMGVVFLQQQNRLWLFC